MNLKNLLNEFIGGSKQQPVYQKLAGEGHNLKNMTGMVSRKISSGLGSGLGSGVAIGGIAALLIGSKKARKFAGSAAKIGGAALLGGLAFKAVKGWHGSRVLNIQESPQQDAQFSPELVPNGPESFEAQASSNYDFQLVLIKAMIAAAKADGHIDDAEQLRIFSVVDNMDSPSEYKSMMMDLLRYPSSVQEIADSTHGIEQKTETYLISCFAVDLTQEAEWEYLKRLELALKLPRGLAAQLREQALNPVLEAA
jgi:uncharacterized membrane protein YebE (DUF533 family)